MNKYLQVLRIGQYYKNGILFLAIFFSGNLLDSAMLQSAAMGFLAFCLISSGNYIINDFLDRKKDRKNPEKKMRPLAAGTVNTGIAGILMLLCYAAGIFLALQLGNLFAAAGIALIASSLAYSVLLKNEQFMDVLVIAVNFVIRAVAGALAISVWISPWLIVGTFFLALFFAAGKRKSERDFLKEKGKAHRRVLDDYQGRVLDILVIISASSLLMSYTLYSFLAATEALLITLPIVVYLMLGYLQTLESGDSAARFGGRAFTNKRLIISAGLYLALSYIAIYEVAL